MIGDAIYVADCKLMTKNLFLKMTEKDDGVLFISKLPVRFDSKLQARIREKAYQEKNWHDVGKLTGTKKARSYKIQEFTEEVYSQQTRLVVVKSSASLASFKASLRKKKSQIEKAIKDLNKKHFACKKDAMTRWKGFCKKYKKAPYIFSMELQEIRTEKRPRGNPGKNPKPPTVIIEWALNIKINRVDRKAYRALRHKAESFVLISNVAETVASARKILKIYKGQIVVELNFKMMKSPALTSTVFLEKEERIEAMMMLIGVSLLIRALMLYKLRKGFKESGEHPKIGYSGIALKTVTMGLFQYAMSSLTIEKQKDGDYHIHIDKPKEKLRVLTLLGYMELEISDLLQ